ncbi:tetraacyldisaccharide 4'-kinase [Verminephrobacter aporrectodeae subsp. tuberculatae]|uniref:Tetraacyldisaccharide 4'-kinase n=1 Tax=Verminephrobacter aporrectodeae subsp. tuberculatae TaxID=1110392 RepID=A0ABT3KYQ3_9BURK|nr:tetraacyldisaccharide 4'-kinase [Verminephrobacter aporrectodeae]MCW5323463.1 tetraacyldisaccharide 4'-kinase [Verminephrobacter aporrectodeae subsp. tuberculatae]
MANPAPARPVPGPAAPHGLQKIWQTRGLAAWALWPLSRLYAALAALRRGLYRAGVFAAEHPGCPVIVVGNVIAGGAGKTPVVIALVQYLQARGLRVGVISRGHGRSTRDCRAVLPGSPASEVGDEPALIARRICAGGDGTVPGVPGVPIFVATRRVAAARALLAAHPQTDVLVCDDGLQHLALLRDLEICVFNDQGTGNGFLLPAGPLRELWPRAVDFVLHAGARPPGASAAPAFGMRRSLAPCAVRCDGTRLPLAWLQGQPLYALAAVARPGEFFAMLRAAGLTLACTEALPDHYDFKRWKGPPEPHMPVLCTEKDALKLWGLYPGALAVALVLHIDPHFFQALDARLPPGAQCHRYHPA